MTKSKQFKPFIATIIAVVVIVGGYFFYKELTKPSTEAAPPPTPVTVVTANAASWQIRIPATGTLAGNQGITLKSAVVQGGIITGIFFRSGQYVKAGQALFQINPGSDHTTVVAPFSGRVGLKDVDLGNYVRTGSPLVTIQDADPMKVIFNVPQTYLSDISLGDTALIYVNSYPGLTFKASVYAINATLDTSTRTIQMWASLPNADAKLLPGMFVNVNLVINKMINVVTVPINAVVRTNAGDYVFIDQNGIAKQEYVTIGQKQNGLFGITSGITDGQSVITSNLDLLADGYAVKVVSQQQFQQIEQQEVQEGE